MWGTDLVPPNTKPEEEIAMSTDQRLSHLADGKRIIGIEAVLVPATPMAQHQGTHLFVNCLYSQEMIKLNPETILSSAREDTVLVLRALVERSMLDGVASVCVSFVARGENAERVYRLYRYSILSSY